MQFSKQLHNKSQMAPLSYLVLPIIATSAIFQQIFCLEMANDTFWEDREVRFDISVAYVYCFETRNVVRSVPVDNDFATSSINDYTICFLDDVYPSE